MRKFSNVSNVIVGQEPNPVELSVKEIEILEFKNEIIKLMDDFLSIRSYGVARPEIMIPTKIVGKEMFIEALTDLLSNKSNKDQIKALESLKSTNKDWKSIEEKIYSIKNPEIDVRESKKINDIIEKYGNDKEDLTFYMESHVQKLSKEESYERYKLVESMSQISNDELLKVLSNKYLQRSNED